MPSKELSLHKRLVYITGSCAKKKKRLKVEEGVGGPPGSWSSFRVFYFGALMG